MLSRAINKKYSLHVYIKFNKTAATLQCTLNFLNILQ